MAKQRILMLTQFYPPLIGGEGQHVRNLSAGLIARGNQVVVATLRVEGQAAYEEDQGVCVRRVVSTSQTIGWLYKQGGRRQLPPFPDPATTVALQAIIADFRPTIIHAHNWMIHSYLPLALWSDARLVLSLHDYSLACSIKSFMRNGAPCDGGSVNKCLRCAARHYGRLKGVPVMLIHQFASVFERTQVDMFLPVSQAVADGNGLSASRLRYQVVPNFIADDILRSAGELEAYLAQLPEDGFLLFVGALTAIKGVNTLLDAYSNLRNAPPLVLIGRTDADTPTTFPAGVHVHRNWPNHAVIAAWQRCSIGIVPSIWPEPCATTAMEAMACGKPVVATRVGGLPDIVVDDVTGLVVPPGDAGAIQMALERLLADAQLRTRLGRAALEHVQRFQASSVIPAIEAIYDQLTTS